MKRLSFIYAVIFLIFCNTGFSQDICLLDLTGKNAELTKGNLFSAEHLLKSGGFSYSVTDSVNIAITKKILLTSSNLESTTFNTAERDSLKEFVKRGGVLISTNCKDPQLNSIFGISSTLFNYSRFYLNFKTQYDALIFKYFDDPAEKQIRFGDTADYITTHGTRAFSLSTGDTLATYETGEVAATHNTYFNGHTYMLGTQYKEVILRAQVKEDYGASRYFSNNFEPAQDVYVFFIAGIIKKHLQNVVYKHTAPCRFKAALVLTHDVDATSSMDLSDDFASYEKENNYLSTYMITTHYYSDWLAGNFFDGYESDIKKIYDLGHDIQSHSVSHVPDFDNESIIPVGTPGNSRTNYNPGYNGTVSGGVSVFGEAEVSRSLLESVVPSKITFFRPGYLAFHDKLINVLDSLRYPFSSSHSANDVMTNFPFFSHTDLDMNGKLTDVLEIPNTISDVFQSDPMSEENFMQKIGIWQSAFQKAYNNNLSSVLLIHPTRYYKLFAQQQFITSLPQDAIVTTLNDYGNYWRDRNITSLTYSVNADTIVITLSQPKTKINPDLSFIVNNGQDFSKIKVYSADLQLMNYALSNWENNSVILHNSCERPNYNVYSITETPKQGTIYVYPNPSDRDHAWLHFEVMEETFADADICDMHGKLVNKLLSGQKFNTGAYDIPLPSVLLPGGTYIVRLNIAGANHKIKWVLSKNK